MEKTTKEELKLAFEEYEQELELAFEGYKQACYGNFDLPPEQLKELRRAFLSGVHWLNAELGHPEGYQPSLQELLGQSAPSDHKAKLTLQQLRAMTEMTGLVDQIKKQHWLNVHFRAFSISHAAWMNHIKAKNRPSPSEQVSWPDAEIPEGPYVVDPLNELS